MKKYNQNGRVDLQSAWDGYEIKNRSVYLIRVRWTGGNPWHEAILVTDSFHKGEGNVFNPTYEEHSSVRQVWDIEVINLLHTFN